MIKPSEILMRDGVLIAKMGFRSWKINPTQVSRIRIHQVISLCDEIGVTVDEVETFFFTDATPVFHFAEEILLFEKFFGPSWYEEASEGIVLEHKKP